MQQNKKCGRWTWGGFACAMQGAMVPIAAALVTLALGLALGMSVWTRTQSVQLVGQETRLALGAQLVLETQKVASQIDATCDELAQLLQIAVNQTAEPRPVVQPLAQRVWAQTNNESNAVPAVDALGVPLVLAYFQLGVTSLEQMMPQINATQNAVMIMRPVYIASDDISQIYITHESGLIGWIEVPYRRADNYRTDRFLNGCTNQFEIGYKPQCDPWFQAANSSSHIAYTLQIDYDVGHLVLTLSLKLPAYTWSGKTVLSIDRDMSRLDALVLGSDEEERVTPHSYRFLMDTATGRVIAHPLYTNRTVWPTIAQLEPGLGAQTLVALGLVQHGRHPLDHMLAGIETVLARVHHRARSRSRSARS